MNYNSPTVLNERFVKLLLESIGEGVFTLNPDGQINSWNPAMERITWYKPKNVMGQSCRILGFNQCFGKQCPTDITECGIYQHGKVEPTECYLKHINGHYVPVIKNARVVRDENGAIIGIVETVTDLTELNQAKIKMEAATRRLEAVYQFGNIIGKSYPMQQVFAAIKAAASSEANVLIQGESGTGKELVAGAIHFESERKLNPLITVNCSALSESLLESELFGHIKGAYTGALKDRAGRFEEADGGTIFLDEMGAISPLIQVKLLRVIQEREIERVGESRKLKVDIRIIAATNKDLYELVKTGHFREDLYYRLKVFPIHLPSMRERKEDIPILANHFIEKFNRETHKRIQSLSPTAMRIFMDYDWPGNVRELENAVEHAFVLCENNQIDIFDLPVEIRQFDYHRYHSRNAEPLRDHNITRFKLTREILLTLLRESGWNKAEVARRSGLSRAAIWKYMKKWEIPLKGPLTY
jgi:two-component system response regulator HydG